MPRVTATIEIAANKERLRQYLRTRYDGNPYREACRAALGRVSPITCEEGGNPDFLRFSVSGRDAMFRFKLGGWSWSYNLRVLSESHTEVSIEYRWHWLFGLIGLGMIRAQAGNALTQDVLAMQALTTTIEPLGVET